MQGTAIHLVDRVIPRVPVRQWVLSLSAHRTVCIPLEDATAGGPPSVQKTSQAQVMPGTSVKNGVENSLASVLRRTSPLPEDRKTDPRCLRPEDGHSVTECPAA
jgi:hypothetical protein